MSEINIAINEDASVTCKLAIPCNKKWGDLKIIETEAKIRHCTDCSKPVFLCNKYKELVKHAKESHCITFRNGLNKEFTGFIMI